MYHPGWTWGVLNPRGELLRRSRDTGPSGPTNGECAPGGELRRGSSPPHGLPSAHSLSKGPRAAI